MPPLATRTSVPERITRPSSSIALDALWVLSVAALSKVYIRDQVVMNVITIDIPPLRDRKEDIVELVSHFVNHYRLAFDKEIDFVPKSVINRLLLHDWPGNVRELENLIQRAVLMSKGKMITEGDLLFDQDPRMEQPVRNGFDLNGRLGSLPLKEILAEVETAVITETLRRCEGNVGLAATQLHIGKTALYDKMKQRGILPKVLRKPD